MQIASVLESPRPFRHERGHGDERQGLGIEAKSDAIYELVEEGSKVERVATGFTFTEGPIWHPKDQYLLFSDMPGDVRRKYTPDGTVVEVKNFSNKCNGMTYDADLNLLVCEHVTSSLVARARTGRARSSRRSSRARSSTARTTSASTRRARSTSPTRGTGASRVSGTRASARLGFQGVYRIAPGGGEPELIVGRDEFEMPNGICFNPDETLFYINDTPGAYIKVYDSDAEGNISNGRMFFEGVGSGAAGWSTSSECRSQ